jgi:hypothetical protein
MKLCSLDSIERMVEDAEKMVRYLYAETGSKRDPFETWASGNSRVEEIEVE